ncbi:MAG: DUF255 domain-containing protein [Candidatus Latescibacteria bacterium]|nr:DUF255 domain-containing protein [Candidatus Latescibacterota bacterium]
MKSSFFITLIAAVTFFIACGRGSDQTATAEVNEIQKKVESDSNAEFTWYTDWDKGIEAAKKDNKPVIIDFYADWCHWCKVMDEKTFSAAEITDRFSNGWIAIKVNSEDKNKQATYDGNTMSYPELVRYFKVSGFPSYLFIDKEGKPVTIVSSYIPKERFGPMLDYMKDELYKKDIKFSDYLESKS